MQNNKNSTVKLYHISPIIRTSPSRYKGFCIPKTFCLVALLHTCGPTQKRTRVALTFSLPVLELHLCTDITYEPYIQVTDLRLRPSSSRIKRELVQFLRRRYLAYCELARSFPIELKNNCESGSYR